jgi:hypothetical protein
MWHLRVLVYATNILTDRGLIRVMGPKRTNKLLRELEEVVEHAYDHENFFIQLRVIVLILNGLSHETYHENQYLNTYAQNLVIWRLMRVAKWPE